MAPGEPRQALLTEPLPATWGAAFGLLGGPWWLSFRKEGWRPSLAYQKEFLNSGTG